MTGFFDTVFAPATVPGTGAITVIRISGRDAFSLTDKIFRCSSGSIAEAEGYTIKYGSLVDPASSEVVDDVLVSVFRAPHSYTGEDCVEISCHASSFVASRVLSLLSACGGRAAMPGEFTRRAFVNGKMDLAQAEAVADLIASGSSQAHRLAVNQLRGGYSKELASLRSALLDIASLLELELDFSEEDVEFADRSRLKSLVSDASERCREMALSFNLGNALKNGIPVAIVGEPNVGKSTLLNALLSEDRAIVSDTPGTTRDSIEETVVIDGMEFRFIDTAGLRDGVDGVEKIGIERTLKLLSRASIVLVVVDAADGVELWREFVGRVASMVDRGRQKMLVLVNKIDCNKNVKALNNSVLFADYQCDVLFLSALSGEGLPQLRSALSALVKDSFDAGSGLSLMVTNERHRDELQGAHEDLERVLSGLRSASLPSDLLAQDLRSALHHIGAITGEVATDEILGEIFSRFCIGK